MTSPALSTASATPDNTLLGLVATGDREAFAMVYDRHAARVYGIIRRCLIDRAQSEEVTQDAFLEIWEGAGRFDPTKGKALSWMMMIAHRRAIDRVRSSQASRTRDLAVGVRDFETSRDDVAQTVETRVEMDRVTRALTTLSTLHQQVITLAYTHGFTQSEIAASLAIPLGTVKSRMRDGLTRLRRELETAA